jgi:hypothetical protein
MGDQRTDAEHDRRLTKIQAVANIRLPANAGRAIEAHAKPEVGYKNCAGRDADRGRDVIACMVGNRNHRGCTSGGAGYDHFEPGSAQGRERARDVVEDQIKHRDHRRDAAEDWSRRAETVQQLNAIAARFDWEPGLLDDST